MPAREPFEDGASRRCVLGSSCCSPRSTTSARARSASIISKSVKTLRRVSNTRCGTYTDGGAAIEAGAWSTDATSPCPAAGSGSRPKGAANRQIVRIVFTCLRAGFCTKRATGGPDQQALRTTPARRPAPNRTHSSPGIRSFKLRRQGGPGDTTHHRKRRSGDAFDRRLPENRHVCDGRDPQACPTGVSSSSLT